MITKYVNLKLQIKCQKKSNWPIIDAAQKCIWVFLTFIHNLSIPNRKKEM